MTLLEIWGGVECTVNRIGDTFHNQLSATGHDARARDLECIAQLGFRRLRYPVLWELTAPDAPQRYDWRWADERLSRLRELDVDPIVGLLHHGSGPRYTDLLDERFPELLATYAGAIAARFPWIERYTPINEPLTTARFSALYGHWYPHHRDDRSFARALVNQCRATVLAMRAIRRINPAAQLIQTDDLGRATSTPKLAYQAEFENERRWLSWDLLCGRLDRSHAMWKYLTAHGVIPEQLAWFEDHPCPPDIIGINHYVTSDRHLDEDLQRFPSCTWGGNGTHTYADVEAVRVQTSQPSGVAGAIKAAWARYQRPLAITEAHLGCTREEQMRWLHEIWRCAHDARNSGIDIRAVTAWALLGSVDWDSLLTRVQGHYEPGVFDVRSNPPRPTALAELIRDLASSAQARATLLGEPGWWRRPLRYYAVTTQTDAPVNAGVIDRIHARHPIVVTGGGGTLGQAFARICEIRGLGHRTCTRAELDICEAGSIEHMLDQLRPRAVINAAGYVRVDQAEHDRNRCYRENTRGAARLASACAARNIPFLTYSSDLVFDGRRTTPYIESHDVGPMNVYGSSKARAEQAVTRAHPDALIVRTSSFFGPWDRANFVSVALRTLMRGQTFVAIDDMIVSPTYVPDLVNASLDLLLDGENGLWHLANVGTVSWAELVTRAARLARIGTVRLDARSWRSLELVAPRPSFSALTSERGIVMPDLNDALVRYVGAVDLI